MQTINPIVLNAGFELDTSLLSVEGKSLRERLKVQQDGRMPEPLVAFAPLILPQPLQPLHWRPDGTVRMMPEFPREVLKVQLPTHSVQDLASSASCADQSLGLPRLEVISTPIGPTAYPLRSPLPAASVKQENQTRYNVSVQVMPSGNPLLVGKVVSMSTALQAASNRPAAPAERASLAVDQFLDDMADSAQRPEPACPRTQSRVDDPYVNEAVAVLVYLAPDADSRRAMLPAVQTEQVRLPSPKASVAGVQQSVSAKSLLLPRDDKVQAQATSLLAGSAAEPSRAQTVPMLGAAPPTAAPSSEQPSIAVGGGTQKPEPERSLVLIGDDSQVHAALSTSVVPAPQAVSGQATQLAPPAKDAGADQAGGLSLNKPVARVQSFESAHPQAESKSRDRVPTPASIVTPAPALDRLQAPQPVQTAVVKSPPKAEAIRSPAIVYGAVTSQNEANAVPVEPSAVAYTMAISPAERASPFSSRERLSAASVDSLQPSAHASAPTLPSDVDMSPIPVLTAPVEDFDGQISTSLIASVEKTIPVSPDAQPRTLSAGPTLDVQPLESVRSPLLSNSHRAPPSDAIPRLTGADRQPIQGPIRAIEKVIFVTGERPRKGGVDQARKPELIQPLNLSSGDRVFERATDQEDGVDLIKVFACRPEKYTSPAAIIERQQAVVENTPQQPVLIRPISLPGAVKLDVNGVVPAPVNSGPGRELGRIESVVIVQVSVPAMLKVLPGSDEAHVNENEAIAIPIAGHATTLEIARQTQPLPSENPLSGTAMPTRATTLVPGIALTMTSAGPQTPEPEESLKSTSFGEGPERLQVAAVDKFLRPEPVRPAASGLVDRPLSSDAIAAPVNSLQGRESGRIAPVAVAQESMPAMLTALPDGDEAPVNERIPVSAAPVASAERQPVGRVAQPLESVGSQAPLNDMKADGNASTPVPIDPHTVAVEIVRQPEPLPSESLLSGAVSAGVNPALGFNNEATTISESVNTLQGVAPGSIEPVEPIPPLMPAMPTVLPGSVETHVSERISASAVPVASAQRQSVERAVQPAESVGAWTESNEMKVQANEVTSVPVAENMTMVEMVRQPKTPTSANPLSGVAIPVRETTPAPTPLAGLQKVRPAEPVKPAIPEGLQVTSFDKFLRPQPPRPAITDFVDRSTLNEAIAAPFFFNMPGATPALVNSLPGRDEVQMNDRIPASEAPIASAERQPVKRTAQSPESIRSLNQSNDMKVEANETISVAVDLHTVAVENYWQAEPSWPTHRVSSDRPLTKTTPASEPANSPELVQSKPVKSASLSEAHPHRQDVVLESVQLPQPVRTAVLSQGNAVSTREILAACTPAEVSDRQLAALPIAPQKQTSLIVTNEPIVENAPRKRISASSMSVLSSNKLLAKESTSASAAPVTGTHRQPETRPAMPIAGSQRLPLTVKDKTQPFGSAQPTGLPNDAEEGVPLSLPVVQPVTPGKPANAIKNNPRPPTAVVEGAREPVLSKSLSLSSEPKVKLSVRVPKAPVTDPDTDRQPTARLAIPTERRHAMVKSKARPPESVRPAGAVRGNPANVSPTIPAPTAMFVKASDTPRAKSGESAIRANSIRAHERLQANVGESVQPVAPASSMALPAGNMPLHERLSTTFGPANTERPFASPLMASALSLKVTKPGERERPPAAILVQGARAPGSIRLPDSPDGQAVLEDSTHSVSVASVARNSRREKTLSSQTPAAVTRRERLRIAPLDSSTMSIPAKALLLLSAHNLQSSEAAPAPAVHAADKGRVAIEERGQPAHGSERAPVATAQKPEQARPLTVSGGSRELTDERFVASDDSAAVSAESSTLQLPVIPAADDRAIAQPFNERVSERPVTYLKSDPKTSRQEPGSQPQTASIGQPESVSTAPASHSPGSLSYHFNSWGEGHSVRVSLDTVPSATVPAMAASSVSVQQVLDDHRTGFPLGDWQWSPREEGGSRGRQQDQAEQEEEDDE